MRSLLLAAVAERGGIITRREAVGLVPVHIVDSAVRSGAIVVVRPGVYADPRLAATDDVQMRAAAAYTGGRISHLDALTLWNLLPPAPHYVRRDTDTHLMTDHAAGPRRRAGLVIHRQRNSAARRLSPRTLNGIPVVSLEQAIVDSWPLLPISERRTPIIVALRERRTTANRLIMCLDDQPRCPGAGEMRQLIGLVASGYHSEFEIYGHYSFLAHPLLARAIPQYRLETPIGVLFLDRYLDELMLAFELDGAAYHGSPKQRERDVRRDLVVATYGIQTIRLTHQRMWHDHEALMSDLGALVVARQKQLWRPDLTG